jgi:hypothetical protein
MVLATTTEDTPDHLHPTAVIITTPSPHPLHLIINITTTTPAVEGRMTFMSLRCRQ